MIELTQGQTIMALALMIFAAIAIGEVMFRFKRRKLKKEHYHLSDYGIDQMIDRIDFLCRRDWEPVDYAVHCRVYMFGDMSVGHIILRDYE